MMIAGEHYTFDLSPRHLHGVDWVVIKFIAADGSERGFRFHVDASDREIAYALRAFAEQIDPSPTKIQPPLRGD